MFKWLFRGKSDYEPMDVDEDRLNYYIRDFQYPVGPCKPIEVEPEVEVEPEDDSENSWTWERID